jgi:glucose-6-phosphate 1-dehydrogenase
VAEARSEPHLFVILGATGDLVRRKLLPALYRLGRAGAVGEPCTILAAARGARLDDAGYRAWAGQGLAAADPGAADPRAADLRAADPGSADPGTDAIARWCERSLHYHSIGDGSAAQYRALSERIQALEAERKLPGNRVFYLALPPAAFGDVLVKLGEAGLGRAGGWTRVVIEKPFGHDLVSAQRLNETAHRYFDESQLYRIDHYLGKETVQNLLFFRFSNTPVEALWNRDRIDHVQVTVAETLGIGDRVEYYDGIGALRDMVQNHLTQLLSLLGMEVPSRFNAVSVQHEKLKVLQAVSPIRSEDVVFGQYAAGRIADQTVVGYRDEPGVANDSQTETYVAMRLLVDSWRWQGVPFYLRTGKRLRSGVSQIVVTFKDPPVCLFESLGVGCPNPDVLALTLQPEPGFAFHFNVKAPVEPPQLRTVPLHFQYKEAFGDVPDAYETLLIDLLAGDRTLFVPAEEAEASWQLYAPLLARRPAVRCYPAGSWGPAEAEQLIARDGRAWRPPVLPGG